MRTRPRYPPEIRHLVTDPVDAAGIGALLRDLRDRLAVSQQELSARMNVLYQNLSRLENGRTGREPTLSTIRRYADALGWEVEIVLRPKGSARKDEADD